jgi:hypothetical protein
LFLGFILWRPASGQPSFPVEIAPILQRNCLSCHGPSQRLSGLDLSSRAAALKGGEKSGPALVPGDAARSPLYRRIKGDDQPAMPMGAALSATEVAAIRRWIDSGAPWDDGSIGAASEKPWAFRKPVRHPVPDVADPRWRDHPVDAFIRQALDQKQLVPAPPANRRTLIRRAYLDLTGLLPAWEDVEFFVNDSSPDAWEKLIDRLLASPHYGERWGRHWLDVARYADSWGHIHDDDNPNAWRFRDYVIRAFNEDKPYDRFIVEQLAGDEVEEVTHDTLIATGFHRIGPRVLFREKQNPHYRYDYLDDMIGTTSRAFLGLTVSCARCHDHKFDPITQLDYYRMMAVFFPYIDYDHPLAPPEVIAGHEARRAAIEPKIRALTRQVREIEEPYREAAFQRKLNTYPEDVRVAVRTPEEERTPGQKLIAAQMLSIRNTVARQIVLSDADRAARAALQKKLRELRAQLPESLPVAAGIRDGDYRFTPDGPGDTPVPGTTAKRIRPDFEGSFVPQPGKPYQPPPCYFPALAEPGKGKPIEPGFLSVITGGGPAKIPALPEGRLSSGRRRALAEWVASPENPLTARVMVNRIWHHHFGRGIVATPSNFGKMGSPPSHPELLDWLATEFIRQRWSVKRMHRLIMTSQTYRMASAFDRPANRTKDPENVWLWRYPVRRVDAEIVRDAILSASGQLNTEAGGPPFFPAVPETAFVEAARVGKWVLTRQEPSTWRRSVYSYWKRARKTPIFEVFDQPDSMVSCDRRNVTTAPTQALTLLNSEFVLIQAEHFAERVRREAGEDPARQIEAAYAIALSRRPFREEMAAGKEFLTREGDLTGLCHVLLNLNEFLYVQ